MLRSSRDNSLNVDELNLTVGSDEPDVFAEIEALIHQEKNEKRAAEIEQPPIPTPIKKRRKVVPNTAVLKNSIFSEANWPPIEAIATESSPIHKSAISKLSRRAKPNDFNPKEKQWLRGEEVSYNNKKYQITQDEILSVFNCMVETPNIYFMDEFFDRYPSVIAYLSVIPSEKLYPVFQRLCSTTSHYNCKKDIWEKCPDFVEWLQSQHGKMLEIFMLVIQHHSPAIILKTIWENNASVRQACKYEVDPKVANNILKNLMILPHYVVKDILQPKTVVFEAAKNLNAPDIVKLILRYYSMRGIAQDKFQAIINVIENKSALEKALAKTKKQPLNYFVTVITDRIIQLELKPSPALKR